MCFSSSIFLLKYQLSLTSELQPKKGSQLKLPRSNSLAVEVILASFSSSFSFLFLDEHMVMCSNFPITILSCTFFGTRVQKKIDWIISSQKIRYLLLISCLVWHFLFGRELLFLWLCCYASGVLVFTHKRCIYSRVEQITDSVTEKTSIFSRKQVICGSSDGGISEIGNKLHTRYANWIEEFASEHFFLATESRNLLLNISFLLLSKFSIPEFHSWLRNQYHAGVGVSTEVTWAQDSLLACCW